MNRVVKMYLFKKQGMPWPPIGWKHFSSIKKSCGQALSKDPRTATIQGLSYNVEASPVYLDNNKLSHIYSIRIDGWTYSIQNESQEYPVLSFTLLDKARGEIEKAAYVSNLKVQARPFVINEGLAHRTIMAALFFMKQIEGSNVPDYEQVLRLYRLNKGRKEQRPFLLTERPKKKLYDFLVQGRDESGVN